MKKLSCLVLIVSILAPGLSRAEAKNWVEVQNPQLVDCRIIPDYYSGDGVQIKLQDTIVFLGSVRDELNLVSQCRAALFQGEQDHVSILVNWKTGEVQPKNGFFERKLK